MAISEAIGFQKDDEGYYIYKDPNATKEYNIDYSEWLIDGDTLQSVVWTVPNGIIKEAEDIKPGNQICLIKLSGGSIGQNYLITAHIVTLNGREDDNSFRVIIREQ